MSLIPEQDLAALNSEVQAKGLVDREHLLKFLTLIPTNDARVIIDETRAWLKYLHDSAAHASVSFAEGDIDAVIGDLDSYGKVSVDTINQFKQNSNKVVAQS